MICINIHINLREPAAIARRPLRIEVLAKRAAAYLSRRAFPQGPEGLAQGAYYHYHIFIISTIIIRLLYAAGKPA